MSSGTHTAATGTFSLKAQGVQLNGDAVLSSERPVSWIRRAGRALKYLAHSVGRRKSPLPLYSLAHLIDAAHCVWVILKVLLDLEQQTGVPQGVHGARDANPRQEGFVHRQQAHSVGNVMPPSLVLLKVESCHKVTNHGPVSFDGIGGLVGGRWVKPLV
jgi:hypothetical protein